MPFSFEFLGTGTSMGVPYIGCDCAVCTSPDPRNKRLRCAALVRCADTTVVVDTGPDFRQQMLRAKVKHADAFVVTHYHADHVYGIDDVRRFNLIARSALDCWADARTLERIRHSFPYVLVEAYQPGLPSLRPREMRAGTPFEIGALRFEPVALDHTLLENSGLLIGAAAGGPRLAYCVDCKRIGAESLAKLRGVEVLVLDMLREKEHPTHMNLAEALAAVEAIGPGQTWLSHMAHEVDHAATEAKLPAGVRLAYDTLVLEV